MEVARATAHHACWYVSMPRLIGLQSSLNFTCFAVARWAWNHTDNIQGAFFNGDGFVSWQNVWGIFQGMTPRDCQALKRVAFVRDGVCSARSFVLVLVTCGLLVHRALNQIQRHLAQAFVGSWTPHTPDVVEAGVFARWSGSCFPCCMHL